ncbi:MAG TPA: thermonuclease family protein, partial [Burkholderiales bacterium]|nr:thermonuclease family protein [Burkholderiales bacterium]
IQRALLAGALLFCTLLSAPANAERVRVTQVLDGDSFCVSDGREIRLIGINAPEFGKDGKPNEPLAREARELLTQLIVAREVDLEYDAERHDRYRRTLAHAFIEGKRSVEEVMLREGFAFQIAQSPNLAHLDNNARAEVEARAARRGVWAEPYFKPRAAEQLGTTDTGFRLVEGRVQRVSRGRYSLYLDLSERFTLVIPHEHWRHFGGDPQRFAGKRLIARGWVSAHENRLRLKLYHPLMIELVN